MSHSEEILHALKCATSQDPAVLRPAEVWLKKRESDGSFYVTLSEICHNYNVEWTIRWLAIVYLKNGIDRHWRPNTMESLHLEQKAVIKRNLCCCLQETKDQVAIQVAAVIAKIARFDYPKEWNDLIPFLLHTAMSDQTTVSSRRSLLVLKHVIKMLSTKRLPNAREIYATVCESVFANVFQLWLASHESAMQQTKAMGDSSMLEQWVEHNLLLSALMSYLTENCSNQNVHDVFNVIYKRLSENIHLAQRYREWNNIGQKCARIVIRTLKILKTLVLANSDSYKLAAKQTMATLSELIYAHAQAKSLTEVENEKFLVNCMNLIKSILDKDQFEDVFGAADNQDATLTQYLKNLFQFLISNYLPLTEENLLNWQDDPEEFSNEEVGESWKFNLRPSAEVLVLTLLRKFPEVLVPLLLNMLNAVQDLSIESVLTSQALKDPLLQAMMQNCSTPLECMVRKEALYYAIGLGVYQVMDNLNFENWLLTKLMPEVKSIQGILHARLIHRRVLWLISQWAGINPSDELRPVLYSFAVSSLDNSFDLAVRLMASVTLQSLLDDFEFDILLFAEHQDSCLQGLYNLLVETKNCDTKMRVLNVFSYLIERLGPHVAPYDDKIANIIPPLWEHAVSQNHDMLKCVILGTMVQFITALGPASSNVYHLTVPLIRESLNLSNPSHVYLLEDGLELWLTTLYNTVTLGTELYEVFASIYSLLEYGSETLAMCFKIIEAYLLLVGENLIVKHGEALDKSFSSLATDVRNECLVLVTKLVCTMVETLPGQFQVPCASYCRDALQRIFHEKDSVLLSANFTLMAHILLHNSSQFWQFLRTFAEFGAMDFGNMVQTLIKIWCDSIDAIVEVDKRKLSALALLTVLDAVPEVPSIANCFAEIICVCIQVLYDVCDEQHIDSLVNEYDQEVFETEQRESPHEKRRRMLWQQAITARVSLPAYASEKLKCLQNAVKEPSFSQLLASVNPQTMQDLQQFLAIH